jgi:putative membrane protein
MSVITYLLVALITAEHLLFLIVEMFLWTRPLGLRMFNNSPEFAEQTKTMAANQGLYNGFLVAGLIWSLIRIGNVDSASLMLFFLACVIAAGLYGGYSISRKIYAIQALPAAIAFLFVLLF